MIYNSVFKIAAQYQQGHSQNPGPGPGISAKPAMPGHQAILPAQSNKGVSCYPVSTSRQPEPGEQKCVSPVKSRDHK